MGRRSRPTALDRLDVATCVGLVRVGIGLTDIRRWIQRAKSDVGGCGLVARAVTTGDVDSTCDIFIALGRRTAIVWVHPMMSGRYHRTIAFFSHSSHTARISPGRIL